MRRLLLINFVMSSFLLFTVAFNACGKFELADISSSQHFSTSEGSQQAPPDSSDFSKIKVDSISHTTARVQWNSKTAAKVVRIIYDSATSSPPFQFSTQLKLPSSTSTIGGYTLGGLAPATKYYYRICSTPADIEICSETGQFTTAGEPANRFAAPQLPNSLDLPSMPKIDGITFQVSSNCSDLQAKITEAAALTGNANHQILIPPQTNCLGNYALPKRNGTGWIVVRSGASDNQLPSEGQRISKAYEPQMPTLTPLNEYANGLGACIYIAEPTSKWRFVGLKFTSQSGLHPSLVELPRYPEYYATNMIFDRNIFESTSEQTTYGIVANSASTIIANNYFKIVKINGLAIAIDFTWAQGVNIFNNYINAPGISLFAQEGGGGPTEKIPSDITIRGNLMEWDKQYITRTIVRHQIEFKSGRRILIEGNVIRSQWTGGQTGGFSDVILFTPRAGWSGPVFDSINQIADVTISNNIIYDVPGGIGITGAENTLVISDVASTRRFLIKNNLIFELSGFKGSPGKAGWGTPIHMSNSVEDIVLDHNTIFDSRGNGPWLFEWQGNPGSGLQITNNMISQNYTNNFGGVAWGIDTDKLLPVNIDDRLNPWRLFQGFIRAGVNPDPTLKILNNLFIPGTTDTVSVSSYDDPSKTFRFADCKKYWSYIPTNSCAGSEATMTANQVIASVKFVGPLTSPQGFRLSNTSPHLGQAAAGTNPGVNMD